MVMSSVSLVRYLDLSCKPAPVIGKQVASERREVGDCFRRSPALLSAVTTACGVLGERFGHGLAPASRCRVGECLSCEPRVKRAAKRLFCGMLCEGLCMNLLRHHGVGWVSVLVQALHETDGLTVCDMLCNLDWRGPAPASRCWVGKR